MEIIIAIGAIIYALFNFELWVTALIIISVFIPISACNVFVIALNIVAWGFYAIKRLAANH